MSDTIIAGGYTSPAREEWDGSLSNLEAKAEADSLEDLHARRRTLVEGNAALIARYGPFGLHDDYRKAYVESQKVRARLDLSKTDAKITETRIDAEAYGSQAYANFLDNALSEKMDYLKVQLAIDEITERIRSREIELRAYTVEAGLR